MIVAIMAWDSGRDGVSVEESTTVSLADLKFLEERGFKHAAMNDITREMNIYYKDNFSSNLAPFPNSENNNNIHTPNVTRAHPRAPPRKKSLTLQF
jgi:hypothetical protein